MFLPMFLYFNKTHFLFLLCNQGEEPFYFVRGTQINDDDDDDDDDYSDQYSEFSINFRQLTNDISC